MTAGGGGLPGGGRWWRAPLVLLFAASLARAAANFVSRAVAAPLLGPSDFGLLALFLATLIAINTFVEGGIIRSAVQLIARARGENGTGGRAHRAAAASVLVAAAVFAVLAGVALVVWVVTPSPGSRLSVQLAGIGAGGLFALLAAQRAVTQGFERFGWTAAGLALAPVLTAAALVALVVAGWRGGVGWVILAYIAPAALLVAVFVAPTRALAGGERAGAADVARVVRFGGLLTVAAPFEGLLGQSDVLFLGWLRPSADVGVYAAALTFASVVPVLSNSVNTYFTPRLTVAGSADDLDALRTEYRDSVVLLSFFGLLGLAGVYGALPVLLPWLFGHQYEPAVRLFPWLIPAAAILVVHVSSGAVYMARRRYDLIFRVVALVLAVTAAAHVLLIPRFGPRGAAAAMALGQAASITVSWWWVRGLTGAWPPVRKVAAATAYAAVIAALVRSCSSLPLAPLPLLSLQALIGLAAIAAGWRLFHLARHLHLRVT